MPPQILRVIDSLQLTATQSVATPVNWKQGEEVVVVPGLTDEQANAKVRAICWPRPVQHMYTNKAMLLTV